MNWEKISDNNVVIELLKERQELEALIRSIDETALIKYELELLSINTPEL